MSRSRRRRRWRRLPAGTRGAVAVEFILIFPILLMLIFAIIDFGHALYMKQMITNAAREGARYGVVYADPKHTAAQIQTAVTNYLTSCGITGATVTFPNPPSPWGATGTPLSVEVKATKTWYVLNYILGPSTDMYGVSVMNNE